MDMHLFNPEADIPDPVTGHEPPQTWWRTPDGAVVVLCLTDPASRTVLTDLVRRVTPLARGLARSIDRREVDAMAAHVLRRRSGSHDEMIATDLLASALLLEGATGDPTAQVLLDHLRRQRGFAALPWPGAQPLGGAYPPQRTTAVRISEGPRP